MHSSLQMIQNVFNILQNVHNLIKLRALEKLKVYDTMNTNFYLYILQNVVQISKHTSLQNFFEK